ncbi:hypothetical protein F4703DRAFT_1914460 [Phycomyces blakesleeanus]
MAGNISNQSKQNKQVKQKSQESPVTPPASLGPSKLQDIADLALLTRPSSHAKRTRVRRRNPNHVPRPMNCFLVYRCEKQKEISTYCPGANHRDISKIIAKWWHEAPSSEKEFYRTLADRGKQQHSEQYPQYKYSPRSRRQKQADGTGLVKEEEHCGHMYDEFSYNLTGIILQDSSCPACPTYWQPVSENTDITGHEKSMFPGSVGLNTGTQILYYPAFQISHPLSTMYSLGYDLGLSVEDVPYTTTLGFSPSSSPDWESLQNEADTGINRSLYSGTLPFYVNESISCDSPKDTQYILKQDISDKDYLSCSFLSNIPNCMYSL